MNTIQQELKKRILVIDGAMGTMIQRYNLTEADYRGERFKDWPTDVKGHNDLLCLTQPQIIKEIHLQYLEAGADIIETNTFNAQRVSLADYQMQDLAYEINVAAARIAKEAIQEFKTKHPELAEEPKFVAGAIGPMNKTLSLSPDVNNPGFRALSFDEAVEAYSEQVKGLIDGGADLLLIETIFDTLNAKAAIYALKAPPPPRGGILEDEKNSNLHEIIENGKVAHSKFLGVSQLPPSGGEVAYQTADPMLYGLLKEFAKTYRSQPTEAENILWQLLRGKKLEGLKFRRQHIIGAYIADFICLSKKIIIEIDGLIHQLPENKLSDAERTKWLNEQGFEVIRFTNKEVIYNPEEVLEKIIQGAAPPNGGILEDADSSKSIAHSSKNLNASQLPPSGGGGALPIMISGTITDASGRTLSGQTLEAFYTSLQHANPISVGLNCALGAKEMRPHIEELSQIASCFTSAYPNAGLPNEMGEYDEQPEETAHFLEDWAKEGFVNIVGGCCGTTPEHIRHIADAVKKIKPRELPVVEETL